MTLHLSATTPTPHLPSSQPVSSNLIKLPWSGPLTQALGSLVERLLGLTRINRIHQSISGIQASGEFFGQALAALNVGHAVSGADVNKIPGAGPLVVVANHPFGAMEGLVIAKLLLDRRQDLKILGNFLLCRIPELAPLVLPLNPFGVRSSVRSNAATFRQAVRWLNGGGCLLVFPAGEVAHLKPGAGVVESPWSSHVGAIVAKTRAPVLPVFVPGRNRMVFQLFGLIHPRLRTALLIRELLSQRGRRIRLFIGKPVAWEKLKTFATPERITAYLRFHTFFLRNRHRTPSSRLLPLGPTMARRHAQRAIIDPVASAMLTEEVAGLPEKCCLHRHRDFGVYVAGAGQIPNLLREIGRLREQRFREVGEGTGKEMDIDAYDRYYRHLFLWNHAAGQVVGGYRIGLVDEILGAHGFKGLYTHSLFHMDPRFMKKIRGGLELGRSFIRTCYQRQHNCLSLLWRGIGEVVSRQPAIRILFGPVSISQTYTQVSKNLMISFLRHNSMDPRLLKLVTPRRPFRIHKAYIDHPCCGFSQFEDISMLITEVEQDQKGVPVLIKHYLKLNGRFVGFNVDPTFSNVVDGLVVVDLARTEERSLRRFMGPEGYAAFARTHGLDMAKVA